MKESVKVLIADDEYSIRNGLRTAVPWESMNMSVIGLAKDGDEALFMIESSRPDIVITDIRMPGIDGIELIEQGKKLDEDIQFIILSGYDDFTYAQKAIKYGAKAYLLKPLSMEEMIGVLTDCKKIKHSQDEAHRKMMTAVSMQEDSRLLFLGQLIQSDTMAYEKIDNKLETLNIGLRNDPVQVVVFISDTNKDEAMLKRFLSTVRGGFQGIDHELWQYSTDQTVVLVNISEKSGVAKIRKRSVLCLERLKNENFRDVIVGIGDVQKDLKHSYYSYTNALSALSYRLYEPDRPIYDSSIICDIKPEISANSIDTAPLTEALRKSDQGKIRLYCQEFFDILFYVPMPPPSYVKGMCIYLISDVQKNLKASFLEGKDDMTEFPYSDLGHMSTLKQIQTYIVQYFIHLAELISEDIRQKPDPVVAKAMDYIQSHMDKKISAEEVASYVNLSVTYFTVYFKSKAGINFRDYLLGTKMDHAKKLLLNSGHSISEIGSAIGYHDYRSFYRAFKNYTGMTPSEYIGK